MTLNSIDWEDLIMIRSSSTGKVEILEIGKFIDSLLKQSSEKVKYLGDNKDDEMGDIQYLDTTDTDYVIPSVDEDGTVSWKEIDAVTKHLPVNKDGTSTLVKITTSLGKQVTATKSKSFLTRVGSKVLPVRGDALYEGMEVPIAENIPDIGSESSVYFDKITKIEEVEPSHTYVYDFTVRDTKNFGLANSLMVRDSFHHSGIATLSSQLGGVPRIKELLSTSKKPKMPSMFIYFTSEFSRSKEMAHKIASHIKHTTLGEIRGKIDVIYDPHPDAKNSIMERDNIKQVFHHNKGTRTGCQSDITGLPWLMRIELNREKLLEKEVNLLDINSKFCSWWEKRFSDSKNMKKEEKKVITKITQIAVLSNTDNDKVPVVHIRFNVKDADKDKDKFNLSTIDNFIDHIVDVFKLKGIHGITDIPAIQEDRLLAFNPETGDIDKTKQYVVYTTGVNLLDIRYINGVDLTKTISNNIIEMYHVFGVEVARAIVLREIANAYERAGGDVNYQHIEMIVDQMTATGQLNSIDRHGMNKSDNDPLARASFEKTVEQLVTAAVYGETDHMRGVSSRIMAGAVIKGGTGYCDLELDSDMIEQSEYLESTEKVKKFTEINKGTLASDIISKKGKSASFVPTE
jgi:DNA-directed RNA polymerase beta' subunit